MRSLCSCSGLSSPISAPRRLIFFRRRESCSAREGLDRHFAACAHQRVFRPAPGPGLDPFRGIENKRAESSRLNRLLRPPIALEPLAREHLADADEPRLVCVLLSQRPENLDKKRVSRSRAGPNSRPSHLNSALIASTRSSLTTSEKAKWRRAACAVRRASDAAPLHRAFSLRARSRPNGASKPGQST